MPFSGLGVRPTLLGALLAAAVVAVGAVPAQSWLHGRHDRAVARFETAIEQLELPPGARVDASGTSCWSLGSLCVTSSESAEDLVDGLRRSLARSGIDVPPGCHPLGPPEDDASEVSEAPALISAGYPTCMTQASSAGVALTVFAGDRWLLPGTPAPRSSAVLTVSRGLEDEPSGFGRAALNPAKAGVVPSELTLVATPACKPTQSSSSEQDRGCPPNPQPQPQSHFSLEGPQGKSVDYAKDVLVRHLLTRGFRVEIARCLDSGQRRGRQCAVIARRFDEAGRDVNVFTMLADREGRIRGRITVDELARE